MNMQVVQNGSKYNVVIGERVLKIANSRKEASDFIQHVGKLGSGINASAIWSEPRRKQATDAIRLIRDLAAINRGSDFIGNIQKCVALASALNQGDLGSTFCDFLAEAMVGGNLDV